MVGAVISVEIIIIVVIYILINSEFFNVIKAHYILTWNLFTISTISSENLSYLLICIFNYKNGVYLILLLFCLGECSLKIMLFK